MKKIMAFVIASVMLFALVGCGEKGTEFDAKGYVQAVMDAKFHREYKEYAEIIGVSEEEAKEQMESEFNQLLETFMAEFKEKYGITDEEMAEYLQLEVDVRAKVQYEVKSAVKDEEGNYTVEVEITPFQAYGNLNSLVSAKVTTAVQNGATTDQYMGLFLESFKECIESGVTGEPVTFTFHVNGTESENKIVYGISEEEMYQVDLVATGHEVE